MATSTMMKKLSLATAGAAFVALGAVGSAQAAGFTGAYDPSNWTLSNSNANGYVNTSNAPASISITGGNNWSWNYGQTTYTTTSASNGLLSFDWSYGTNDWSAYYDPFGFILNGAFTQLTNNNLGWESGTFSTLIAQGDVFGFGVNTVDNTTGAATATISNLISVPEPASTLGLLALGAMGAGSMLKRKQQQKATVKA